MKTHQAPPTLKRSIRLSEDHGRALVTTIDHRLAIILPRQLTDEEAADKIALVARVLGDAGFDTKVLA